MDSKYLILMWPSGRDGLEPVRESLEEGGYTVRCTGDPAEALKAVQSQFDSGRGVDAVVVRHEPACNDALVLLEHVQQLYAQPVRMLIAEPGEAAFVAPMLNRGVVERLLLEPCTGQAVCRTVEQTVGQRRLEREYSVLAKRVRQLNEELQLVNANIDGRIKEKAEELMRAIYYDELTGLASRTLLKDRLEHDIAGARRHSRQVAVFLIGLDRFKFINDSLGREAGDAVLVETAGRISQCVRSSDTVGRFTGDVFGLITTDPERVEHPGFVARRILDAIALPINVNGQDIFPTASIGICLYPDDGQSAELLLANAETAMGQAKLQNSSQFRYYSGEFNQMAGRRLSLESELRKAIANREFLLYYQPRIDTELGRVVGAEALLRWQHPLRGIVPPLEFLPLLEETNLIDTVGEWVLEEAAGALSRWREAALPPLLLAVNLSARQFHQRRLPEVIGEIAGRTGLNLEERRLELEITESLLMENVGSTRNMLDRLHAMGIKIAIDDFGTGYSALSYLIQFPLDYLKIDKSFVDRIDTSDDAKAIVEAVISLSYSLRLGVIAEGVETRQQLLALQSLGCKQFQGYLFARPMIEEEFIRLVEKDAGAHIVNFTPEDRLLREPPPRREPGTA